MRVSTATCWWSSSSIEEGDIYIERLRHFRKHFFCFVNTPVSHDITTVLGSIRKTEHNGLLVVALCQVRLIGRVSVKLTHNFFRSLQVVHCFEKRNHIYSRLLPST